MPVHDWTRVEAGFFHSFHNSWIAELCKALNSGLLPADYVVSEQHTGHYITDLLTLHASRPNGEAPLPTGPATAVAEAPPKVRRQLTAIESYRQLRRTLALRHVSGHRLIAVIEIVSPANKDRAASVGAFVTKTVELLDLAVHVLLVDLLPPGRHDPRGMHGAVWEQFAEEPYDSPAAEPLTLASYSAGPPVRAFVEHLTVGAVLPEVPVFLHSEHYIQVPLEPTYQAAYRGVPAFWRDVLEGRRKAEG